MESVYILTLLAAAIGFIIFSSVKLKWHPFLSLLVTSLAFGLLAGIPAIEVVQWIGNGFGTLIGAIGLIVVLGSILGTVLEGSGSVTVLGQWLNERMRTNPSLGMSFLGLVLGIPVFCDSGFIILVSLARSLSVSSGVPFPTMTLSLSSGLYTTHTLVPPTPGPVAAAGNLSVGNSLGLIILLGMIVSVPVVLIAHWYSKRIGQGLKFEPHEIAQDQQPVRGNLLIPVALIALPILLIAVSSLIDLFQIQGASALQFIGNPTIALLITVSFALLWFRSQGHSRSWVEKGIFQAGPILLLTGCGGALGSVLKASALSRIITEWANEQSLSVMAILFAAFAISAGFKTAQGSSTSAMVIVSALFSPLAIEAGFDNAVQLSLLVLAIGAGAMTVSHANDSYFWVVSQFSGFDLRSAYRGITVMTLLQGLTAFAVVLILFVMLA